EGTADVRGRPAGGDADGHIVGFELGPDRAPVGGGVLGVLDRVDQSLLPAGDMPEHPAGFEVERRQQFAGVEDAQSAGGAGSEVVDTAASAHALCRDVDELGQLRQGGGDRVDDGVVLRV